MSRIHALEPAAATPKAQELLAAVKAKIGMTPNMMKTMAQSEAVLEGYLSFSGALGGGVLSAKLREQIAIAVGQANSCQYCLSAHTLLGKMAGLAKDELDASRRATSSDPKTAVALHFAHDLVAHKGMVDDQGIAAVRAAGFTEAEIVEIVSNVALNIFTNYFNNVAQTEVDFPKVELALPA
ncbi:MAG: carboxymuconolactone decarboxylase family protein [Acidobacteria bacterium]|nr:carboxymuconolactone decarboxylase family protein [Acidobacteriota bacterium]